MPTTNAGPKSARRAQQGDGPDSPLRSSSSFVLPPLDHNAYAAMETLEGAVEEVLGGSSPARRSRRHGLVPGGDPATKTVVQATMNIGVLEQEMTLARENHRDNGRVLLELWVNQVLDPGGIDISGRTEPLKMDTRVLKGLTAYGLTRAELRGAGLSDSSCDRLYRGLYVYTVGFFDIMQDILHHSEFRVEILGNVWRAFLAIAESALKVAFKSEYLQLFQAQQVTAAELLIAKEALAEARSDSYNTEKALAWLTAAHAEERTMRASLKQRLEEATRQMELEQRAHQSAVEKYVGEVEARTKLQVEAQEKDAKLLQAALAHADLISQRDKLLADQVASERQCSDVVALTQAVTLALVMDDEMGCPEDLREQVTSGAPGFAGTVAKAQALKLMAEGLYGKYRVQKTEFVAQTQELYVTRDKLRVDREKLMDTEDALTESQRSGRKLTRALGAALERNAKLESTLAATTSELDTTTCGRDDAEARCAQLRVSVAALEASLSRVTGERETTAAARDVLSSSLSDHDRELRNTSAVLASERATAGEVTKLVCISMSALQANQTARALLQRTLTAERLILKRAKRDMEEAKRTARILQGKCEETALDMAALTQRFQTAQAELRLATSAGNGLKAQVDESDTKLTNFASKVSGLQRELSECQAALASKTTVASAAEAGMKYEKTEVMRLFAVLQELEAQMGSGAEERMELVKRVEALHGELRLSEERGNRKAETLLMDNKRLQSEMQLEGTRAVGLELQLEAQRKRLDEVTDAHARKREKKRRWKHLQAEAASQFVHLTAMLEERTRAVVALEERLSHFDVDLAIMVADRGRRPPQYTAGGPTEYMDDGNYGATSRTKRPATPVLPQHLADAVAAHTAAQSGHTDGGGGKGDAVGGTARDGEAADAGTASTSSSDDIRHQYLQWDGLSAQALTLQLELDADNKVLAESRRAFEKARAVFYTNASEPELRKRMEAREAEVRVARAKRAEVEARLSEVNDFLRALQAKLRHHEQGLSSRRLHEVERRSGARDLSMRSELSARMDEVAGRAMELQALLAKQQVAYDMALAAHSSLEGTLQQREEELSQLANRLEKITTQKLAVDAEARRLAQVAQAQAEEISKLTLTTHEQGARIAKDADDLIQQSKEAAMADRRRDMQLRRAKDEADEREAVARREGESNAENITSRLEAVKLALTLMTQNRDEMVAHAAYLVDAHVHTRETADPPVYLPHFVSSDAMEPRIREVVADLPPGSTTATSNFLPEDPMADYIQPPFETVLVVISQVFSEKILADLREEEFLLGGLVGRRCSLSDVLYDHFMSRLGMRDVAEMHLTAFVRAVMRHMSHHPKIRVFARLLGLDATTGPLPHSSADFYCALLNRVHARGGPLVGEAVEGFSFVKCRVIAKAAREFMRGPLAPLNDEAGNITQALTLMAGGDEEKVIDLEIGLEMAFKAWVAQYQLDLKEAVVVFGKTIKDERGRPSVTPGDFHAYLTALNAPKALALSEGQVMAMYRQALCAAGPAPTESLGAVFAATVLDNGFVGLATHLQTRLEPIKGSQMPPYDEHRTMVEVWKSIRPVVEAQMVVLDEKRVELRVDDKRVHEQYKNLERVLEENKSADVCWAAMQKVLGTFFNYRAAVETIQPFCAEMVEAVAETVAGRQRNAAKALELAKSRSQKARKELEEAGTALPGASSGRITEPPELTIEDVVLSDPSAGQLRRGPVAVVKRLGIKAPPGKGDPGLPGETPLIPAGGDS
ncbi:hypothetical protein FOA52_008389 [Chlamydomonas sp. UWO 241]|nr:hypothetical protein FOA52_008389 [Chlamydomonas sp. UWO 241]